jgi:hypothetical protein
MEPAASIFRHQKDLYIMKMDAACSTEMLVSSCQTTWRYIPQDHNLAPQMILMKNEETEFYILIKSKISQAKTRTFTLANT